MSEERHVAKLSLPLNLLNVTSGEPSVTISDFNVTFRPYERSKNVELAPMNGFRTGRSSVSPCTAVDPTSWSEKGECTIIMFPPTST